MTFTDGMHVSYNTVVIFLLIIFTTLFAHTYFFIIRQYHPHLSDIPNFEKTLERLPKSTLLHINGSIKHLGAAKQIYVINLPYRKDRRTGSVALFQTLDLDASIVPAYNIHSSEVVSRTRLVDQGHITLVELACWASHMRVWLEIAASENNDSWVFIFEDDIDLEMVTFDVLESLPRDVWNIPDMIYLGYCGDPSGLVMYEGTQGYRVHQAINPSCTHAYAIRSRTASRLIDVLSSPRKAVDDEIVHLVDAGKILAFSIHPPLALQQRITSSYPSDVNPMKHTLIFQIKKWITFICHWWRGVEFTDHLKDSALARADFNKADNWRIHNEHGIWLSDDVNVSSFPLVK